MKFSDELIADVARTLQVAILTGTDIVDHLRTFEVEDEGGYIKLTKTSKERIEREIKEMADRIESERSASSSEAISE
jgi:hypothetical protein